MLKGECNNILNPFNGNRQRVPRESLANYNFDAAKIISRIPVVLSKKLLSEGWKPKRLEVAIL
jgi:hypothetical protein